MKTTKMSLANIEGKLSRAEMKKIMAGSDSGSCGSGPCSVYNSSTGDTAYGTCGYVDMGGGLQFCECNIGGFYNPNGGVSHCYQQ